MRCDDWEVLKQWELRAHELSYLTEQASCLQQSREYHQRPRAGVAWSLGALLIALGTRLQGARQQPVGSRQRAVSPASR